MLKSSINLYPIRVCLNLSTRELCYISISRSEDAKGIDIKKNERAEAVFKLPSHQLQAGDPQYEIAKLMYQDLTNKKFD